MNWAWAASLDHIWRSPSFPMWITLAAALFFAVVLLVTLARAEKSVANGALTVITLLAIGVAVAATIRGFGEGDRVASAVSAPDAAILLPALSCLDGLAGENVEASCEKALFASPDATAAAVSYTSRQLSRLNAASADPAKSAATPDVIAIRRTIERDRYGFVAQVLTTRDRCDPSVCDAFRFLHDYKQIAANMVDKTYDNMVGRYSLAWGASLPAANAVSAAAPASSALAAMPPPNIPTGKPTSADFPTSASIPAVNIMGAEPVAGAPRAPSQGASNPPSRSPSAAAASSSPNSGPAQSLAPARKPVPKQQRTTAPVQLAPPPAADDN